MPEQTDQSQLNTAFQPKIEEFSIDAKLVGTMDNLRSQLSKIPFYLINAESDEINLVRVESRSINKRPYLFHIITFKPSSTVVTYSYPPDSSLNLRRAAILKNLSGVLSMVSANYTVNTSKFLQYVDSVIENITSGLSQNYTTIYNRYESLLSEYRDLRRLNVELAASNRNLTIQSAQLSEENKKFKTEVETLRKYSDESLMALVEEWIQVHGNSIDVIAFGKAYEVAPTRVEQVLDKMVSLGYIEAKS